MKKNYYLLILVLGTMFHLTAAENSHKYLRLSSDGKVVFGVTDDGAMQTHITIPKGVTTIEDHAFNECYALKSITIPKGVTTIEDHAFDECSSLKSVVIPNGVITIGVLAFNECSSLESVTIPKSVTTIGALAFRRCYALKSITIPKGVTTIGVQAFNECEFKTIYYDGTKEEWDDIVDGPLGFDDEVTVIGKGGSWVDW